MRSSDLYYNNSIIYFSPLLNLTSMNYEVGIIVIKTSDVIQGDIPISVLIVTA